MSGAGTTGARIVAIARSAAAPILRVRPVERLSNHLSWLSRLAPIIVIAGWWLLSFSMYLLGWPITYLRTNVGWVSLLIVSTLVLSVTTFSVLSRRSRFAVEPVVESRPPWIAIIGLVLSVVLLFLYAEYYSGYHLWEIGTALANQGTAFSLGSERISDGTQSRIWLVAVQALAAPLTMMVLPYFSLAWFERRQHLGYLVVAVAVPVAQSVLVARDFQVVLTAVVLGASWLVSRVRRRMPFTWRDLAVFGGTAAVAIIIFSARKMSRNPSLVPICTPGSVECIPRPTIWDYVATSAASYASHGYEGLGRALEGTWRFGGGFGHVPAVQTMLDSIFGRNTTVVITDQLSSHGWDDTEVWSTGLSWLANDLPWAIIPFVIAAQAVLLAIVWRRTVRTADALSVTLFSYTFLSLLFMMQNLQLALSGPVYIGYLALCAAYLARYVSERRRARRANGEMPARTLSTSTEATL